MSQFEHELFPFMVLSRPDIKPAGWVWLIFLLKWKPSQNCVQVWICCYQSGQVKSYVYALLQISGAIYWFCRLNACQVSE
jgi:hypothetical protein